MPLINYSIVLFSYLLFAGARQMKMPNVCIRRKSISHKNIAYSSKHSDFGNAAQAPPVSSRNHTRHTQINSCCRAISHGQRKMKKSKFKRQQSNALSARPIFSSLTIYPGVLISQPPAEQQQQQQNQNPEFIGRPSKLISHSY